MCVLVGIEAVPHTHKHKHNAVHDTARKLLAFDLSVREKSCSTLFGVYYTV